MRKVIIFFLICLSLFFILYLVKGKNATSTMQYFPMDGQVTFHHAKTNLSFDQATNEIIWETDSDTNTDVYLRQDVSLLYENGKFKGVLSKWEQQAARITLQKRFVQKNTSLLESISFHHGEVHYPNNEIKSVQQMTKENIYFVHDSKQPFIFQKATTSAEQKWKNKLDSMVEEQLLSNWRRLMKDFSISEQAYELIPLTALQNDEHTTFPGRTEAETKQIIGQLWEGLYKNYIVLLANDKIHATPHFIPLILLAKDNSHLLVIYELNNEKQKLIQNLPTPVTNRTPSD